MIDIIKGLLGKKTKDSNTYKPDKSEEGTSLDPIAIATAVLCLEIAHSDDEFSPEEKLHVPIILEDIFNLSAQEAEEFVLSAEKEINRSSDLWHYTNIINKHFDKERKKEIMYAIWRLVYIDSVLDKYEDYLMHKISKLLNLSHDDLIETKLRALHTNN